MKYFASPIKTFDKITYSTDTLHLCYYSDPDIHKASGLTYIQECKMFAGKILCKYQAKQKFHLKTHLIRLPRSHVTSGLIQIFCHLAIYRQGEDLPPKRIQQAPNQKNQYEFTDYSLEQK